MVQRSIGNERKLNLVRPNAEEETEIAAQLAEDPDTYEWTEEDWANAQTTRDLFPEACEWAVRQKEALKDGLLQRVTVTLDRETIAWFEAQTGEDGEDRRGAVAGTGRTDPAGPCPRGGGIPETTPQRERCGEGAAGLPDSRIPTFISDVSKLCEK